MIYSENIEKRCGLCRYARPEDEDSCFCERINKSLPQSEQACKKFSYDILKKPVRRRPRRSSGLKAEDFRLE